MRCSIPITAYTREDLTRICMVRDRHCVSTGARYNLAIHEVMFKRSEKPGEGHRSQLWHPYNCVVIENDFHLAQGATATVALSHLAHLLKWHGVAELNDYIDWIDLKSKPANVEQWVWRRAQKLHSSFTTIKIDDTGIQLFNEDELVVDFV